MTTLSLSSDALANNTQNALTSMQRNGVFKQLFAMIVLSAAIAGGLWLFFWTQKDPLVPVQAGLDAHASAELAELMATEQIPYQLDAATGAVTVPQERLQEARLKMAAAGLGDINGPGMAMIERDPGFGVSQFVENARYQRALETELARTISQLRSVREARVHLAIPKPSAFTRDRDAAAASVVLQLQPGRTLSKNEVDAIVHLVASSIPNLEAEKVTVVDEGGSLLTSDEPADADQLNTEQFERVRRQESKLSAKIAELLEPVVGAGRVRSQVAVDMDFAVVEEAREVYAPDSGQIRSEQVSQSSRNDGKTGPQGIPGATSNAPPGPQVDPAAATAAATPTESTSNQTRNYELDRTLSHTRQPSGRVRRITAAVLLDHMPGVDKDGEPTSREMTAEELTRMESLVKQAIGFDQERGDQVSVVNAAFVRPEPIEDGDAPPIWNNPMVREILRIGLGGITVLLLIWFVLRPALRTVVSPPRDTSQPLLANNLGDPNMQVQMPAQPVPAGMALPAPNSYEARLQLAKQAVAEDPKRVAQVVKEWVSNDG